MPSQPRRRWRVAVAAAVLRRNFVGSWMQLGPCGCSADRWGGPVLSSRLTWSSAGPRPSRSPSARFPYEFYLYSEA